MHKPVFTVVEGRKILRYAFPLRLSGKPGKLLRKLKPFAVTTGV